MTIIDTEKAIGDIHTTNTMHGKRKVEVIKIQINYICENENGKHVLVSGETITEQ